MFRNLNPSSSSSTMNGNSGHTQDLPDVLNPNELQSLVLTADNACEGKILLDENETLKVWNKIRGANNNKYVCKKKASNK